MLILEKKSSNKSYFFRKAEKNEPSYVKIGQLIRKFQNFTIEKVNIAE